MFNWVYRFVVLGFWCGFGVLFYVNRASYTVDQFGVFACGWLCVLGLVFFLRDVSEGYRKDELVQAKAHEALWKEKWLGERENVRLLESKRCPRAGGWLVREWPGYFLRDDSDLRRDGRDGVDEEAYSLFRLEPYGRVEVFVGPLGWALERAEKCVARGDGPEGVSTPEDDKRYRELLDTAGKVFSGGFSEGEARRIAENVAEDDGPSVEELEAQTDCWAAMKESEGFHQEHHNLIPNRRYKFLSLPNGSKFRYDGLDTVFVKLSDFSQRGEAIGLVAKFDGFDIKKFLATGDYLDSSQVFCAAEIPASCKSLVVTVLE